MTHWYVGYDSLLRVAWLVDTCDMTHSYVRGESTKVQSHIIHLQDYTIKQVALSLVCAKLLMDMRDITCWYVWNNLSARLTRLYMPRPYVWQYIHLWHDPFICATWLIDMCDTTLSYMWHDSFVCIAILLYSDMWNSGMLVSRIMHMCHASNLTGPIHNAHLKRNMIDGLQASHSYATSHDLFICNITRRIHMCDMTHWYVRHDSLICATWFLHTCDMTHLYV